MLASVSLGDIVPDPYTLCSLATIMSFMKTPELYNFMAAGWLAVHTLGYPVNNGQCEDMKSYKYKHESFCVYGLLWYKIKRMSAVCIVTRM